MARTTGFIRNGKTGDQIAWIEDGKDVFSVATHEKFATVRGTDLYSLSGEFLNMHLESSDEITVAGNDAAALAQFRKLACVSP
jgi:hypothetical protein